MRFLVAALSVALIYGSVVVAEEDQVQPPVRQPQPVDRLNINPIPETEYRSDEEADREVPEIIGGYFHNRWRDLWDIFTFKFGWGTEKSLGFQARAISLVQVGAGIFEGGQLVFDRGCVGTMHEYEMEGGISIFYPSYIVRQVTWQTKDAERRNVFFNNVGRDGAVTPESLKYYNDENNEWFMSTAQVQLPYLPKIEISVHWGELFDFPISFFGIPGFRVPAPFYKHPDATGEEMIPAPSIFWHGQERFEKYK